MIRMDGSTRQMWVKCLQINWCVKNVKIKCFTVPIYSLYLPASNPIFSGRHHCSSVCGISSLLSISYQICRNVGGGKEGTVATHRTVTLTLSCYYCKNPKNLDIRKIWCNHPKIWTIRLYHRVMFLEDADGIANSVDPDQTAPLGAVWSGSALFAQAYLSENLGSLSKTKHLGEMGGTKEFSTGTIWTVTVESLHMMWNRVCIIL